MLPSPSSRKTGIEVLARDIGHKGALIYLGSDHAKHAHQYVPALVVLATGPGSSGASIGGNLHFQY